MVWFGCQILLNRKYGCGEGHSTGIWRFTADGDLTLEPRRGHLPHAGGQSGDPRSDQYRKGHNAWIKGKPTTMRSGPAVRTIRLQPAG